MEKIGRADSVSTSTVDLKSMLNMKFGNKAPKLKKREEKRQFNQWKGLFNEAQWRRWEANEEAANVMSELQFVVDDLKHFRARYWPGCSSTF